MAAEGQEASASHGHDWLAKISALELASDVEAFWADRPDLQRRETIEVLTKEVTRLARHDPPGDERLSRAAESLAVLVGDDYGHALDFKVRGHLRFLIGKYEGARAHVDGDSNPIAEVPAFLFESGRIHSQDLSGPVGDFTLQGDSERASRLCLLLDDDLVDVPLPRLAESRSVARTH